VSDWDALRTENLLGDLLAFVRRFIVLTDAQALAVALWVLHTHAFDAADTTPYLAVTSAEKRSGKTRLLEVLTLLVAEPLPTANISDAALFRVIEEKHPTLLFDEVDAIFGPKARDREDLRGLLNSGYRRGSSVYRMGGARMTELQSFEVFCPKALAGIGRLPDTITDRAIPIQLERKTRAEQVERMRARDVNPEAAGIRDRLADWATPNLDALRAARPLLPDELDDRAQDVWEPLLAIAELANEECVERAWHAALELSAGQYREDESLGVRLLADIRTLFDTWKVDRASTADLLPGLSAQEEAPWGHWRGKPLTGQTLAEFLKSFGIRSRTIHLRTGPDGKSVTAKGYLREQFEPAFARYLASDPSEPSEPVSETAPSLRQGAVRPPSEASAASVRDVRGVRPEPVSEAASDALTDLTPGANGHVPDAELSLLADAEELVRTGEATFTDET
jgi:hypothetical protein